MIAVFIVLLVVALGGAAYIGYDVYREMSKKPVPIAFVPPHTELPATEVERGEENAPEETGEAIASEDFSEAEPSPQVRPVKPKYIVIKYSRSFLSKLIQSDDSVKGYYSELKNKLLSYDKVKSKITWKCEIFRTGRKTIAKLRLRGKTLSICLALDPDQYAGTKYRVENLSEVKSNRLTPCGYKVKTDRRLTYAKDLIEGLGLKEKRIEYTDYAKQYPYEDDKALIQKKLIKVLTDEAAQSGTMFKPSEVREKVTATEVDGLMKDEVAASLIEQSESNADKTKQGIINIDTIGQYFESGETVTLDEVKKRIKRFNKQTTYLKVLARGALDKPLTVEADSFSLQAVKMIILTGGKAIKKR